MFEIYCDWQNKPEFSTVFNGCFVPVHYWKPLGANSIYFASSVLRFPYLLSTVHQYFYYVTGDNNCENRSKRRP